MAAAVAAGLLFAGHSAAATVEMVDAGHPTRCAEEDNVYVTFAHPGTTGFRLAARQPPYVRDIREDSTAPDFSECDMSHDPSFPFTPRTVTFFDDGKYRLVGHTFKTNWRPESVPFRVPGRVESGLHLVQLFKLGGSRPIEFLVLYPADGYWRAKPLPTPNLAENAYGSSFLIGPIIEEGRPFVAISDIEFDPAAVAFRLRFTAGGSATLRVAKIDAEEALLEVTLTPEVTRRGPFAALRSMYVSPAQADVAEARWRGADGTEAMHPVIGFGEARISEVRFGRTLKSRHNLSAPEYIFGPFTE